MDHVNPSLDLLVQQWNKPLGHRICRPALQLDKGLRNAHIPLLDEFPEAGRLGPGDSFSEQEVVDGQEEGAPQRRGVGFGVTLVPDTEDTAACEAGRSDEETIVGGQDL